MDAGGGPGGARVQAVTPFVRDPAASRGSSRDVLGLPEVFADEHSAVFRAGDVLGDLLVLAQAGELVEPLPVAADGPVRCLLALALAAPADVDAAAAAWRASGARVLVGPVDRPWGVRTASTADPDGHAWEVAPLGG